MNTKLLSMFINGLIAACNGQYARTKSNQVKSPYGTLAFAKQSPIQRCLADLAADILAEGGRQSVQLSQACVSIAANTIRADSANYPQAVHTLHFSTDGMIYYNPESVRWHGNLLEKGHHLQTYGYHIIRILTAAQTPPVNLPPLPYGTSVKAIQEAIRNETILNFDKFAEKIDGGIQRDKVMAETYPHVPKGWVSDRNSELSAMLWFIMWGLLLRYNMLPPNVDWQSIAVKDGSLCYHVKDVPVENDKPIIIA